MADPYRTPPPGLALVGFEEFFERLLGEPPEQALLWMRNNVNPPAERSDEFIFLTVLRSHQLVMKRLQELEDRVLKKGDD